MTTRRPLPGAGGASGAAETVTWLGERGYQVHFLTNNSGTTRRDYVKKLTGLGIQCEIGQVMTSCLGDGYASTQPKSRGPLPKVAVIGLGTGTMACYAQKGQDLVFFDIDPTISTINFISISYSINRNWECSLSQRRRLG